MERTSRLLLGLEALPASLLLRFGAIITVHKGFLNKHFDNAATNSNSENAGSRMVTSLRGSVGTGTKGDESSTGRVWAAGVHHVRARSRLARVLKLMNLFISLIFQFFRAAIIRGYGGPPVYCFCVKLELVGSDEQRSDTAAK